jgi:CubicO group peptidase (beta-lactamase class C family)
VTAPGVHGHVDARFAAVRDAFVENFVHHGELGAAVCVACDGRVVVDLWGGHRDLAGTVPWADDTLVDVFSVGKGLLATAVARLVGRGALELDTPVASWWPAFGAAGKEAVTLRHLLSHRAGLPAVRETLPDDAMLRPAVMRDALAATAPWWPPGTAHGYHVNTFGFLIGAAVEWATGVSVGTYLRDEVCGPIGADLHVGLADRDLPRVAEFRWAGTVGPPPDDVDSPAFLRHRTYFNPPGLSGLGWVNTAEWRRAEHPSTNAHGTARGVARLYTALVGGGLLDGVEVVGADALAQATREEVRGDDLVLDRPSRFGLGFQLTTPERPLGRTAAGFGHFGAGGSLGFCDPGDGVAFGYVTNDMGPRWQNPRNRGLLDAVASSLG